MKKAISLDDVTIEGDGTAHRSEISAAFIVDAVGSARLVGASDMQIATELLVAAIAIAKQSIHHADWATALETSARLLRSAPVSERMQ